MGDDVGFVRGQSLHRTSALVRLGNISGREKQAPLRGC